MKPITSFTEAKQYLDRFYLNARTKYTLTNMRQLMAYLDNPQNKFRAVHVAGTSGKTSTAYYMAALLTASGQKTGLTISPHIDEINERVQINGRPLPEAEFCRALTSFLEQVKASPVKPSWFEAMVAFAYWYFAREKVDYAVVEVGLGGLKDGTNVIDRADKICIITDIGYDHTNVLGKNLTEIAAQKIGIVGQQNTVFTYRQTLDVMKVIENQVSRQQASLQIVNKANEQLNASTIPKYQYRNWQLAYWAFRHLEQRDHMKHLTSQELAKTQLINIPGRMEIRQISGKTIIMDGAHNVQKMTAFVESFHMLYPEQKPAILLAVKEGKDYQQLVPVLAPLASRIITTSFKATQDLPFVSMSPEVLGKVLLIAGAKEVISIADQNEAFQALLTTPEKVCIITGSFYLLSQIRNNGQLV